MSLHVCDMHSCVGGRTVSILLLWCLLFAPLRLWVSSKIDPRTHLLLVGWSCSAMCPVVAVAVSSLSVGLVCVVGPSPHPVLCVCPLPFCPDPDSHYLGWLWFQIFGIFLARTLISDIEAVKAGHHF